MKTETDIKIIENVKVLRKELKISQCTLAEIIGTSYSFVGQVERKNCLSKYSAHQIYLIAKYFGCQVSDLYPPIDPLEP
ncbi:MAG: helix-turn-helix domain-containing protein [Alistipes sp.]|nr:helix-turn-helix domain-containing protein [Alistipes sp.]